MSIDRAVGILETELSNLTNISSVNVHPKRKDQIVLPAILLDVAEIEPGEDRGTDQLNVVVHFEARIVMSDQDSPISIWLMVQSVVRWLFDYDFPERGLGKSKFKSAAPDNFSPDLSGHRVWVVEWTQEIRVGENVWVGEPPIIEQLIVRYPVIDPEGDPEIYELDQN